MILIANSSSTRAEWALVEGQEVLCQALTAGINPIFQPRREISHIIRLGLPEPFFKSRASAVYFYGPGCATPDKLKTVESSLVAQFRTSVSVNSDLLGAARGLLGRSPGIVCVLSTGSNSCVYDGQAIVQNTTPGGYLLGDEGSNAYLGKRIASDILKGIAPARLVRAFFEKFDTSKAGIIDAVYSHGHTDLLLARYSEFLLDHIDDDYCRGMVHDAFMDFFARNIARYDYKACPLSFVGRTCCAYEPILRQAAADFGAVIGKIEPTCFPGLIAYHTGCGEDMA